MSTSVLNVMLLMLTVAATTCRPTCETTVLRTVADPSTQRQVIVFTRDCGATTGLNTQVALVGISDARPDSARTFLVIDDTSYERADSSILDVTVQWVESHQLLVNYDHRARIIKQQDTLGAVAIRYTTR